MARSNACARHAPARGDEGGQMMILAAIVLLVGFLALAGMVARVNQLGTQTGVESRQAVLDEAGPLKLAMDNGLARLANRTFTGCCTWNAGVITSSTDIFSSSDVGLRVKGGSGGSALGNGAVLLSVTSARIAVTNSTTPTQASATTINLWKPGFALKTTTTPTAETAAISLLEHLQRVEAGHGLWMDWRITCVNPLDPTTGLAIASLSDATLWLEVRASVTFPRADCAVLTG